MLVNMMTRGLIKTYDNYILYHLYNYSVILISKFFLFEQICY